MLSLLSTKYPHMRFSKNWEISKTSWHLLGQCETICRVISDASILPDFYQGLLGFSLIKNAQAATSIKGSMLTEEEIKTVREGGYLPQTKKHQQSEVRNILGAFDLLQRELNDPEGARRVTPELIKRFHKLAGEGLADYFEAVPGEYRADNKQAGKYRCPDHEDIPLLMDKLCAWLPAEFRFGKGQDFSEVLLEAILSHAYIEWIRPFGDGNSRAGHLLEFYILIRGGVPPMVTHIIPQYYNQTRTEYRRQMENANNKRDLSEFIEYALSGFADGLRQILEQIHKSQRQIVWNKCVYDFFSQNKIGHESVALRMRNLLLGFELEKKYRIDEIRSINPKTTREYAALSPLTLERDLAKLVSLNLLIREENFYRAIPLQEMIRQRQMPAEGPGVN